METKHSGNILIVDDEEPMRRLLDQILSGNGYLCRSVAGVEEAKTLLRVETFNLILSDIRMPGESGLELCRHIKTTYPDTAVMLITAIDDMDTANEAISMDIYGYIIKPITTAQLLISVTNAMRRHQLELKEKNIRNELEAMVCDKTADLLKANEDLSSRESELKELNTALSILLRKMEQEKNNIETRLVENVTKCVLPYFEKLRSGHLNESQQIDLGIAERNIRDVISPFINKISSPLLNLTQSEIHVANLIKQGMSTKEIASAMNLSTNTIMTHRAHIREKLNMKSKKEPLFSLLNTLA